VLCSPTIVVHLPDFLFQVHAKSAPSHRWLVVADAAAYVPTHQLDLSAVQPDFVPISFYKIFGEWWNDVNRSCLLHCEKYVLHMLCMCLPLCRASVAATRLQHCPVVQKTQHTDIPGHMLAADLCCAAQLWHVPAVLQAFLQALVLS
jgi:hypothetical protein